MKKKWELLTIDHDFLILPDEEFKQLLAEFSDYVYLRICQLQNIEPLNVASLQSQAVEIPTALERTGTDG